MSEMISFIGYANLIYIIGFSTMFFAGVTLLRSSFKGIGVVVSIVSLSIALTKVVALATHSTEPVTKTLANGNTYTYFPENIWNNIQYPVFTWGMLILSFAFLVLSVQIRKRLSQ